MFTADLDAEYDAEADQPLLTMKSTSAAALEMVTTFFVAPFSRRGRKAFKTRTAPMTFVLNCGQTNLVRASEKEIKGREVYELVELLDKDVLLIDAKKREIQ